MDRVFSVDEMADHFWSPHAPPVGLHDDADVDQQSSSAAVTSLSKMTRMNRSPSEWAFQRFLEESASADHNSTTLKSDDVVEIHGDANRKKDNQQSEIAAAGGPLPIIPVDSEEYQAFLKSRLELACAAVALSRVISLCFYYVIYFVLLRA